MKKRVYIVVALMATMLLSACGKEMYKIETYERKMRTVMSNDMELADDEDNLVVAVGEQDELYPDAKIVDMTLAASNGELILSDTTNEKTYNGTYKILKENSHEIIYEITIDGETGYATVSQTEHYGGTEIPTLPINLGEYSLYFVPSESSEK